MKLQISLFVALLTLAVCAPTNRLELSQWEFSVKDKFGGKWFPATTPSNIHLDLLANKLIEDPFVGTSESVVSWIDSAYVTYRTNISVPNYWNSNNLELVFEGLDTYCSVTLNGSLILNTNNSFVRYTVHLNESVATAGNSTLEVSFTPSKVIDAKQENRIHLPFGHGHSRKAPYHYGWDWAPSLVTMGIWRPVYIQSFTNARFDYVWIRDKIVSQNVSVINCAIVLHTYDKGSISDSNLELVISVNQTIMATIPVNSTILYKDIEIKNPKFWWPHNVGTPNFYEFEFTLKSRITGGNQTLVQIHGIRTIKVHTKEGAFQFKVNGHPVYAKGANYVPADMFHPRFANPALHNSSLPTPQQYVETMVQSNYNMIRIWGGGQYETNEFYELLSKRGIMVFHDFMFSVNTYPAHEEFFSSVEIQLKQQIRRIRNYPCLALWSGNNEVYQGIREWGWGSEQYVRNYDLLFEKLIRKIVEIESPDIFYIPSSPWMGSGSDTSRGDIHYWQVWAGSAPFENYDSVVGRFNSEFGTQAFPVWETTLLFAKSPANLSYESPEVRYHEKHGSQFNTLRHYIEQTMHKSINFEMEVYQSGLTQALGVGIAIVAQRIEKQRCWGTLYWQFNDAWPSISWASMDYLGRWKPLQYIAKNLYSDWAVLFRRSGNADGATVWAVSDQLFKSPAVLRVKVFTLDGTILFTEIKTLSLEPNSATLMYNFTGAKFNQLLNNNKYKATGVGFFGEMTAGKDRVMRNTYYVKHNNQMEWSQTAVLDVTYTEDSIVLSSNHVIRSLYISHKDKYIQFSDNYFDVIPGETYTVTLKNVSLNDAKAGLIYRSYVQSYTNTTLDVKFS